MIQQKKLIYLIGSFASLLAVPARFEPTIQIIGVFEINGR